MQIMQLICSRLWYANYLGPRHSGAFARLRDVNKHGALSFSLFSNFLPFRPFHTQLSPPTYSLYLYIFSMSSIHLFLGLTLFLLPVGFHSSTLLRIFFPSIRITWPSQVILWHLVSSFIYLKSLALWGFLYPTHVWELLRTGWICDIFLHSM